MIRIAIDGTASSGKGTLAKKVARILGFQYIDTGALYRAIAYLAKEQRIPLDEEDKIAKLANGLSFRFVWNDNDLLVFVNDENVSNFIRTDEAGRGASIVSSLPAVRSSLLSIQQNLANRGNVVMDGRDIGTVIIPDAELKIYVDADLNERAKRRRGDFLSKGFEPTFEEVRLDLKQRDERDKNRPIAPLRKADDAFTLDTTNIDIDQGVDFILYQYNLLLDKGR